MITHAATSGNAKKVAQLQMILAEILAEVLRRGFHGTAGVELSVQDGTIQHIRRKVERIEKGEAFSSQLSAFSNQQSAFSRKRKLRAENADCLRLIAES